MYIFAIRKKNFLTYKMQNFLKLLEYKLKFNFIFNLKFNFITQCSTYFNHLHCSAFASPAGCKHTYRSEIIPAGIPPIVAINFVLVAVPISILKLQSVLDLSSDRWT